MDRRDFLKGASALAGLGALASAGSWACAAEATYPAYENNLQDRLWMWGHDPGVYDGPKGVYNIPLSAPMSMAEGIKSMGIPNVCVIRGGTPDAEYRKQFKDVKRIAWDLAGGTNQSYHALKDYVLYKEGQIEGLIFHCTPRCNKGLAAVDFARQWIAKHGKEGRNTKG